MCSQNRRRSDSQSQQARDVRGHGSHKTWSQKRAERLAHKATSSSPSESPITVSSEGSGAEDSDGLPDLNDFLPDLDSSPAATRPGFFPLDSSSPVKQSVMGSPRKKHSKERHFMDTFCSTSKHRKLEDDRDSLEDFDIRPKQKNVHNSAKQTEKTDPKAGQTKRRRDRISQEMQAGSSPVQNSPDQYKVFAFPHDLAERKKSLPADEQERRRLKNKFSGIKFLHELTTFPSSVDTLCKDFVKLQTSCLDDLSDDLSDPSTFSNFMDLLEDFSTKRKPPSFIIDKVVDNGFFSPVEERTSIRSYSVILKVWQLFPDLIKIDVPAVLVAGDVLQRRLQNTSPAARSGAGGRFGSEKERPTFDQARLYFQLFLKGLQLNLSHCRLADQKSVNKSLAFACLSAEGSQTLVKQLTHWLDFCLVVRQPEQMTMAKQWMCELQSLLGVCILISRDRQEAAKKLAPELKRTYKYLTDLCAKKQFLQSFSCSLLCFYVLRLVMEDQCESTIVSSQFPSTIHEVIHNYYVALPPQDHMTPPPSPSDDEHGTVHGHAQMYSLQSCEELAMLIYFISKSFIACKQRRLSGDLRPQILKGSNVPTLTEEQRREFQRSVQEFGAHLRSLSVELSSATITYLKLLECLCQCT